MLAQNPFEIPKEMRELAEKNVEQARAAYAQVMDTMMQAMGMWSQSIPSTDMTSGFKVVQDRAASFAKRNAEAAFTLASDLASARDIQQVLSLQSQFAQSQLQAYAFQAQELGRLMAETAQAMRSPR